MFCKGFGNSTATFLCYVARMGEMAKFPYLTGRKGSCNLYYKREVPPELRADGRPSQVWRSLGTSDRKKAECAYGAKAYKIFCKSCPMKTPTTILRIILKILLTNHQLTRELIARL